jgi:hypothetical protein
LLHIAHLIVAYSLIFPTKQPQQRRGMPLLYNAHTPVTKIPNVVRLKACHNPAQCVNVGLRFSKFCNVGQIFFMIAPNIFYTPPYGITPPPPQSQIPNLKSQIPNPAIPNLKSQIPNPKSQISNIKSQIPNPKSQIPNPKSQISNPKSEIFRTFALAFLQPTWTCEAEKITRINHGRKYHTEPSARLEAQV